MILWPSIRERAVLFLSAHIVFLLLLTSCFFFFPFGVKGGFLKSILSISISVKFFAPF